jgi:hypothetical protein
VWHNEGAPGIRGKEVKMVKNENVYSVGAKNIGTLYPTRGNVVAIRAGRFCVIDDSDNVLWWFTQKQTEYLRKLVMEYELYVIVNVSEDRVKITLASGEELHLWRWGDVTGTALSLAT